MKTTTLTLTKTSLLAAAVAGWEGLGWNNGSYFTGDNLDADGRYNGEEPVPPLSYTDKAKTACIWGALAKYFKAYSAAAIHSDFTSATEKAGLHLHDLAHISNIAGSKEKALADVKAELDEKWPDDKPVTLEYVKQEEMADA